MMQTITHTFPNLCSRWQPNSQPPLDKHPSREGPSRHRPEKSNPIMRDNDAPQLKRRPETWTTTMGHDSPVDSSRDPKKENGQARTAGAPTTTNPSQLDSDKSLPPNPRQRAPQAPKPNQDKARKAQ
ncbi:hypothetical protein GW17_00011126 [Ensete ventricosum]|nr:hypothetical protein GW17_00011126 [Ensete ventricosum]